MIKFSLRCERGHEFESWFPDSQSFDAQARRGLVQCALCDSVKVEKAIMAPAVHGVRDAGEAKPFALVDQQHKELRSAIQELRRKIEENTTDVGTQFPDVARAIHTGEEPDRPIRGRATRDEAHALIQEGIGILPVPSLPEEAN